MQHTFYDLTVIAKVISISLYIYIVYKYIFHT